MKNLKTNILLYAIIICIAVYIGVFIGRTSSVNTLFVQSVTHASSTNTANEPALIDINRATEDQLMMIAEIDAQTAKAIIDYRTQNGSFINCLELTRVNGINYDTYLKIKPYITVGGAQ